MDTLTVNVDRVLSIGQRVRICLAAEPSNQWVNYPDISGGQTYASHLEDLLPDSLAIAWPSIKGIQVPFECGQKVTLKIPFDRGVLILDSTIAASSLRPIPVLYVARSGDWTRTQLRLHVRLYVGIVPYEVLLVMARREDGEDEHVDADTALQKLGTGAMRGVPFGATIQNLSAGGMLLASSKRVALDSLIRVRFPLANGHPDVQAFAHVVWIEEDNERIGYDYRTGCQFVNLGARQQDIITKFIFAKQVEMRQRGLL